MSNFIDSLQLSGTNYSLKDPNATNVTSVTQAEYDALVTGGTLDPTVMYVISDAQPVDISQYWTSAQTNSAINEAVSGKLDTSVFQTYSGDVDTALANKVETSAITTAVTTASTDSEIPTAKAVNDAIAAGGGGGGGVNVVQTTGTSTTDVMSQDAVTTALANKADTSAVTAIQDSLSGYVTTDTEQTISGKKIFTYTASNGKSIEFKQTKNDAKVGFRVINSELINNELATFEFRPKTYTDSSSVSHPLLYLGHYRTSGMASAGVPQTMIGFRQYDQSGGAAYHYLMPLPAEAKTPFSLTTRFKDYFAPLGFKVDSGGTMVTTDNTGVVDLSSYLGGSSYTAGYGIDIDTANTISVTGQVASSAITTSMSSSSTDVQVPSAKAVYDQLGGMKIVKLTESEYATLVTKDADTLYIVIPDPSN